MANEVPNAVALRKDPEWKEWVLVAAAYQARVVILEPADTPNHEIRMKMAREVAFTPESIFGVLLTVVSTDPAVCSKGSTAAQVTQQTLLGKVEEVWTPLANLLYAGR